MKRGLKVYMPLCALLHGEIGLNEKRIERIVGDRWGSPSSYFASMKRGLKERNFISCCDLIISCLNEKRIESGLDHGCSQQRYPCLNEKRIERRSSTMSTEFTRAVASMKRGLKDFLSVFTNLNVSSCLNEKRIESSRKLLLRPCPIICLNEKRIES